MHSSANSRLCVTKSAHICPCLRGGRQVERNSACARNLMQIPCDFLHNSDTASASTTTIDAKSSASLPQAVDGMIRLPLPSRSVYVFAILPCVYISLPEQHRGLCQRRPRTPEPASCPTKVAEERCEAKMRSKDAQLRCPLSHGLLRSRAAGCHSIRWLVSPETSELEDLWRFVGGFVEIWGGI